MGGELFLRKDWFQLGKEIRDRGMKLLIISNGYCVTNDIVSKLVSLQPHAVATSLDGGTATIHDRIRGTPGSFKKVMEFLTLCRSADLPVTVITTVSKLNIHQLPQIKDFLLRKTIAWQIQIASPEGRFPRDYAISQEEYYAVALFIASLQKKYTKKELPVIGAHCLGYHSHVLPNLGISPVWNGCPAGTAILSIKSNGDVIGCLAISEKYIEGNIRKKSIIEIWNSLDSFAYNRKFTIEDLGENCRGCSFGTTCRGGCMGMSSGFTKHPHNTPYCFYKIEQGLFPKKRKR
jgi:radical SAM protein with 4Fe4S-binding SPASM domain